MRRQIIILISVVLIFTASTIQASYPEHYVGDPVPDGCHEVEAWITDWHDMNPWGQVDPTGGYFLFGELCVVGGVADLNFDSFAWRECRPKPWGDITGDDEICTARYVGPWLYGDHHLGWTQGLEGGFYYSGLWFEDRWSDTGELVFWFDALTFDSETETATFVEGVWYREASIFMVDDDRYTRTTWTVRKRQTDYTNSRILRPSGRRAP